MDSVSCFVSTMKEFSDILSHIQVAVQLVKHTFRLMLNKQPQPYVREIYCVADAERSSTAQPVCAFVCQR